MFGIVSLAQQTLRKSNAYIQTCYQSQTCYSISQSAMVTYNANYHDLTISMNFSEFKTGVDSLDEWLADLTESNLVFKVQLNEDQFPVISNHNSKSYRLKGDLTVNNQTHKHVADIVIFDSGDSQVQTPNSANSGIDKLHINFSIQFLPKEFGIDKKKHHLKKTIFINIGNGYINYIRQ